MFCWVFNCLQISFCIESKKDKVSFRGLCTSQRDLEYHLRATLLKVGNPVISDNMDEPGGHYAE